MLQVHDSSIYATKSHVTGNLKVKQGSSQPTIHCWLAIRWRGFMHMTAPAKACVGAPARAMLKIIAALICRKQDFLGITVWVPREVHAMRMAILYCNSKILAKPIRLPY